MNDRLILVLCLVEKVVGDALIVRSVFLRSAALHIKVDFTPTAASDTPTDKHLSTPPTAAVRVRPSSIQHTSRILHVREVSFRYPAEGSDVCKTLLETDGKPTRPPNTQSLTTP